VDAGLLVPRRSRTASRQIGWRFLASRVWLISMELTAELDKWQGIAGAPVGLERPLCLPLRDDGGFAMIRGWQLLASG
jgi:hypothetical protein